MLTEIKKFLEHTTHQLAYRVMRSMNQQCGMKVGIAWQNAKTLKPQDVTTVILVDPKDVTGAPRNGGEKIAMQVTKRVKRGVHVNPTFTIAMPLQLAIRDRL